MDLLYLRVIERVLAVLFGGLSIYLGYRLFIKLPEQKDSEGKPQKVQVVNLLVTPEQAERLTLASSQTHIQLVLRNPLDTETASPPGARL